MSRRHYINLTNGLAALDHVRATGESWSITRIRSTTLERADWYGLLMVDLDADLLLHLALGVECVIHDRGTRRPLSKTLYFGVPLVRYLLERWWYGRQPASVPTRGPRSGPGPDRVAEFAAIYEATIASPSADGGQVRSRLDYFGRYAGGEMSEVRLVVAGGPTYHDGDREHWHVVARRLQ